MSLATFCPRFPTFCEIFDAAMLESFKHWQVFRSCRDRSPWTGGAEIAILFACWKIQIVRVAVPLDQRRPGWYQHASFSRCWRISPYQFYRLFGRGSAYGYHLSDFLVSIVNLPFSVNRAREASARSICWLAMDICFGVDSKWASKMVAATGDCLPALCWGAIPFLWRSETRLNRTRRLKPGAIIPFLPYSDAGLLETGPGRTALSNCLFSSTIVV